MSFGGGSKCWIFNDDIEVNFWGIKRGILMVPNLFSRWEIWNFIWRPIYIFFENGALTTPSVWTSSGFFIFVSSGSRGCNRKSSGMKIFGPGIAKIGLGSISLRASMKSLRSSSFEYFPLYNMVALQLDFINNMIWFCTKETTVSL